MGGATCALEINGVMRPPINGRVKNGHWDDNPTKGRVIYFTFIVEARPYGLSILGSMPGGSFGSVYVFNSPPPSFAWLC